MLTNIILCSGNGTRLWPISRNNLPKQFLAMFDSKSFPAIAFSALSVDPKIILFISTFDHLIKNYEISILRAKKLVEAGYGYIKING